MSHMTHLIKLEKALALLDETVDEDRAIYATDEELDASTRKFNEATEVLRELVKQMQTGWQMNWNHRPIRRTLVKEDKR